MCYFRSNELILFVYSKTPDTCPQRQCDCLWLDFLVHTWIAASLLVCFQLVCVCWTLAQQGGYSHFVMRKIHYYVVEWRKASDFLSETVVLDGPSEIWRHCVCVCVFVCLCELKDEGVHSSLHHFLMDKFPPSSRRTLVVTVMTSGFLLLFWRAVGCDSRTGSCQHESHCSPSYRLSPIASITPPFPVKW